MCSPKVMASTLKAKGYGDDNILGEFDDDYLFPRQRLPETLKGSFQQFFLVIWYTY